MGRAVGVGEVEGVVHAHRAVVARPGRDAGEVAGHAVQARGRCCGREAPVALRVGHAAHAVDAVAVVEAVGDEVAARTLETYLKVQLR